MKRSIYKFTAFLLFLVYITPVSALSRSDEPSYPEPLVSSWAQEAVNKARELGIALDNYMPLEDYRAPITRAQFRSIAMAYVAVQQHCDSSSLKGMAARFLAEAEPDGYSIKEVFADGERDDSLAYYLGLVEGRGDGSFDPDGLITRQEAAVMLTRAYGVCGGKLPEEKGATGFTDEQQIADWARESVSALFSWNVMKGMEDGSFSPEDSFTVEQCIVTFLRLYENAPVSRKNGNAARLFTYEQGMEYVINHSNSANEKLRLEGPAATFIRMDLEGMLRATSSIWFVYRDGGVRRLDTAVSNESWGFTPEKELENPHFSEDGKTFRYAVALDKDVLSYMDDPDGELLNEKGIYYVSIDVDTGKCQVQRDEVLDALPTAMSEAMAEAYAENIRDVLEVLDKHETTNTGDVWKSFYEGYFRGTPADLNEDGQSELVMLYLDEDDITFRYKIYAFEAGDSALLREGILFLNAGAPGGGISLVSYNNERYVCVWESNSEAGEHTKMRYSYELYNPADLELPPKHIFSFTYHISGNGEAMAQDAVLTADEETLPFDEFLRIKNNFDNPIRDLCSVGNRFSGYELRRLYENLDDR